MKYLKLFEDLSTDDYQRLCKSTDIIFQVIKNKILKGQITNAIEYLEEQREILNNDSLRSKRMIGRTNSGKLSDIQIQEYREIINDHLQHLRELCREEFITDRRIINLIDELIQQTN